MLWLVNTANTRSSEALLGFLYRGVNQISDLMKRWIWGSAMLISKILGVSIDTPDTPLTGPLHVIGWETRREIEKEIDEKI